MLSGLLVRVAYGVVLLLGIAALLAWIAGRAAAENGWRFDPEEAFGIAGRRVVSGFVGFGMGGLSASYAGWPAFIAAGAAIAGAGALAWYSGTVDLEDDEG